MASYVQDVVVWLHPPEFLTGFITMNESYPLSRTNKIRQLREKGSYDRETIHRVLDAGLVAHVAFVQDAAPVVVPDLWP